jgi:hypothetical protein
MYLDNNLPEPRWFCKRPRDWGMRIPGHVLNGVLFLGRIGPNRVPTWTGTGFVIAMRGPKSGSTQLATCYLVTARHIVGKNESRNMPICIRGNKQDGGIVLVEDGPPKWWFHPDSPDSVDVAVAPWDPPEMDFTVLSDEILLDDQKITDLNIGPGDDVVYTGLFHLHAGSERNLPIVRTGTVAMMPDEPLPSMRILDYLGPGAAYLVEIRSIGGLSGSPVFVRESIEAKMMVKKPREEELEIMKGDVPSRYHLMGLMHGQWNIHPSEHNRSDFRIVTKADESIALGISVVVPAKKILEVLNHPELVQMRNEEIKAYLDSRAPTPL